MHVLETKEVIKQYANHLALDRVSISVPENTIFGLLGPNGAGKTTLLRIVNRITGPDHGEVLFNGRKLMPEDVLQMGYLPEERGLYRKMKVGEQALYLAQLKGLSKGEAIQRLKYWFEKFEIQSWWDKKVEELSKGMQQKLQFIATVLHRPRLLIFDEPFSGFDPINTLMLKNEILELRNQGATVIFSTHNMESVEEICDNIALIHQSKVVLAGGVQEIKETYRSQKVRLEVTERNSFLPDSFGNGFTITSSRQLRNRQELIVQMDGHQTLNNLLQTALTKVQIVKAEEVVPGMNDIFIQMVEGN